MDLIIFVFGIIKITKILREFFFNNAMFFFNIRQVNDLARTAASKTAA